MNTSVCLTSQSPNGEKAEQVPLIVQPSIESKGWVTITRDGKTAAYRIKELQAALDIVLRHGEAT